MGAREMFALVDVTTDGWGARANYDPDAHGGERPGNAQTFTHHPGDDFGAAVDSGEDVEAEMDALRRIEAYAMRNGWWGIAYDIAIGMSGTKYAGRGLARSGATSGDVDDDGTHNNDEGEAILILCSPDAVMTLAAKASYYEVLDAHGGDHYGHKEAKGIITSCPGEGRMRVLDQYRDGEVPTPLPEPTPITRTKPKPTTNWTEDIVETLPLLAQEDPPYTINEDVRRAQGLLASAGLLDLRRNTDSRGRPDGKFGPSTNSATRKFQQRHGLTVDGLIGKNTWTALLGG